ncbi:MAG: hypothetical protein KAR38_03470 [Calditrichia bacterium]|nr:hypothetical protein [Calditrichia bacterium]
MMTVPVETFHSLEFPKIIDIVNSLSLTPYSKKYLNNIKFSSDKDVVIRSLQEVQQMKEAILYDDALPFTTIEDLRPLLEKLTPEESFLEVNEIVFLKHHLALLQEVEAYFSKRKEKYKLDEVQRKD